MSLPQPFVKHAKAFYEANLIFDHVVEVCCEKSDIEKRYFPDLAKSKQANEHYVGFNEKFTYLSKEIVTLRNFYQNNKIHGHALPKYHQIKAAGNVEETSKAVLEIFKKV